MLYIIPYVYFNLDKQHQKICSGGTPIHSAARNGSAEVVEILVDNGADIEAKSAYCKLLDNY